MTDKLDISAMVEGAARTILEAEQHLQLPTGTIARMVHDNDYLAVMKATSTIEPILYDALEAEIGRLRKHKIEHEGATVLAAWIRNNGQFERKVALAKDLGLINQERYDFITCLYEIRGHYAHHIGNLHLSITEVIEKRKANLTRFYNSLVIAGSVPERSRLDHLFRAGLYFQLASFLADALHVIKPPPLPSLLGNVALGSHKDMDQG